VGQRFPSSPDPLPLSYAVGYEIRLSVPGSRRFRNTRVTYSIHRKPVSEREIYMAVILHLDKQIVSWDQGAYCYLFVFGMKTQLL